MATYDDIINKLDYLEGTKQLIKQAIVDKGQTINDSDTFRTYVDKIKDIVSNDFVDASSSYTVINTVNVNDNIAIATSLIPNLKVNTICLVNYLPSNGDDNGLNGILILKVTQILNDTYNLSVMYKYLSTGSDDIKLFETIEDMNSDESAKENDLAVVYSQQKLNLTTEMTFQVVEFPYNVILPTKEQSNTMIYIQSVDDTKRIGGYIQLTPEQFGAEINIGNNLFIIKYESTDGLNYSLTQCIDYSGNITNIIDYGRLMKIRERDIQYWVDNIGYFMQVILSEFGGLYRYSTKTDTLDKYMYKNFTFENNELSCEEKIIVNIEAVDNFIKTNIKSKYNQFSSGILVREDENTFIICSSKVDYQDTLQSPREIRNNDGISNILIYNPSNLVYYKYIWTIHLDTNTIEENITEITADDMYVSGYYNVMNVTDKFVCTLDEYLENYSNYVMVRVIDSGSSVYNNYIPRELPMVSKYRIAENQYTLALSSDLKDGFSAYGKNGNIIGTYIPTMTDDEYEEALALAKDIKGII